MRAPPNSLDSVMTGVRWLARVLSLVTAGTVALFFVGEGRFEPLKMSGPQAVQMLLFGTAWLGLLVAWRWELTGAAMTLGGMALFYAAEFLVDGHFPRGWAFAAIAFPGVLFLYCGLRAPPVPLRTAP